MYLIKAYSPTDAWLQSHQYLLENGNKDVMNESINMSVEIEDKVPEDDSTVTLFEYMGCDSGSEILFYQVNDGGHGWPGDGVFDSRFDLGNWNKDINASLEILSFFHIQVQFFLKASLHLHGLNNIF